MIDLDLFEKILSAQEPGYINTDDRIDRHVCEFLSRWPGAKVQKLFKQTTGPDIALYQTEFTCPRCKQTTWIAISKTRLLAHLRILRNGEPKHRFGDEHVCKECRDRNRALRESQIITPVIVVEKTQEFIRVYLSPHNAWPESAKQRNWYDKVSRAADRCDQETIRSHVCSMTYREFLKTPYWKAVSAQARQNAGYKCALCGRNDAPLAAHHSSYDRHGREHIFSVCRQDIICLCSDCHTAHHSMPNKKPNHEPRTKLPQGPAQRA